MIEGIVGEMVLKPDLLLSAYIQGFFPMPDPETGEIMWLKPEPRAIIPLEKFHCSRSLKRTLRRDVYSVSFDKAFRKVMEGCADRPESWITDDFFAGYGQLHDQGIAHSVEVWKEGNLAGGLYGVALNGAFFAESKFHRFTDASKIALFHLVEHLKFRGFSLLEVQFLTPHLESLGAIEILDKQYMKLLDKALSLDVAF
jgi:leucyl/phenylalanyl-tRNA---protein transferase